MLVDKEDPMDNAPAWRPPALCDATPDMVESHLALLPHGDELRSDGSSETEKSES